MDSHLSDVEGLSKNPAPDFTVAEGEPEDDFVADVTIHDADVQKHKRGGHKLTSPTSPTMALRNSQAGPHKCERIHPRTGRPCRSTFSRPHDLTRHEDTIHNSGNQMVRCQLCTEKPFSRNDALSRHMRVVHPDVDWRGKTGKTHTGTSKHG